MSFETEAHRIRKVLWKYGNRTREPIFAGAGLMECPSVLVRSFKGNLPDRDGIA